MSSFAQYIIMEVLYHGSPISGLKEIKINKSTQQGNCVYAATNLVYAAVFGAIKGMLVYPRILTRENIIIVERKQNQLENLKNKKISIYVLSGEKFNMPREHDEDYERTSNENQKVLEEIIIEDVYEFLKQNNVEFVDYKDRTKYGIPSNDEYFIPGILKTYCWKIIGRKDDDLLRGNEHIEVYCKEFPDFREKIYYLKNIIDKLDDKLAEDFIKNLWDKDKNSINCEIINEYINYIEQNNKHISR